MRDIAIVLAAFFGPPLALLVLGLFFWRLHQVAALTGKARQRRVAWLVALASGITGSFYFLLLVLSDETPGAHGPATSQWPWLHQYLTTTVTLASLGVTLLLLCFRFLRPAGLSFGAGALLVLAGLGTNWYLTDHQENLLHDLHEASARYDQTGWQKAVTDSFHVQLARRSNVRRHPSPAEEPVFLGGEAALQQHLLTRSPGKHLPPNARVAVEFIVERDGHVTLPHVVGGLGPGYDEAAVRTVQHLPAFEPLPYEEGRLMVVWVPFYN
jgi:hypothetical protein